MGDDDKPQTSVNTFTSVETGGGETITVSDRIHAYVWVSKYRWIWLTLILIAVFVGAFLGGYATGMAIHISNDDPIPPQDYNSQTSNEIANEINARDIDSEVKIFTKSIHQAGTDANKEVGRQISNIWSTAGLKVRELDYTGVLLQFPYAEIPNTVQIVVDNRVTFESKNDKGYFLAYSGTNNGNPVDAKLVYVNYGTFRDFETLKGLIGGCETTDTLIAIARYGSRRAILKHAEEFCADNTKQSPIRALILYPDPADFAPDPDAVWPNGPYLTEKDAMFGTLYAGTGDPLTPSLPSVDGVYREDHSGNSTSIVVQSISYGDAAVLMKDLLGTAPQSWIGNLSIPYYGVGPGYTGSNQKAIVRVNVRSDSINSRKSIKNIVAVIPGDAEKDRYVIVGAHYDSWTYGGNDPNGASSILNRLAIAFQRKVDQGWKPRRSIIFAHWDAELFRKIGSQEFVEHFGPELHKRVVAYINVDLAVEGTYTFHANGHPLLAKVAYESTKRFSFPKDTSGRSVYEVWKSRSENNTQGEPSVKPVGITSDVWAFWGQLGVPYLYPIFRAQRAGALFRNTMLDTYDMLNNFIDPGFAFHELLGRIIADSVTRLSDSAILPYTFTTFSESLLVEFDSLASAGSPLLSQELRDFMSTVRAEINKFITASKQFDSQLSKLTVSSLSDSTVRMWNDLILTAPQAFTTTYNSHYRRYNSLIYGADYYEDTLPSYFPGVYRSLIELHSPDTTAHGTTNLKRELSALFIAFKQATDILSSKTLID